MPKYAFAPYERGHKALENVDLSGSAVQALINKIETISQGTETLLNLLQWDQANRQSVGDGDSPNNRPVLNDYHRETLQSLAIVNLGIISNECGEFRQWAFDYHTEEGRLEKLEQATETIAKSALKIVKKAA
uniref:Uncharacterized protein n=1 Tax=Polaromonas sp. H8N TaxID=1840297 RepID=A0A2S1FJ94_9BURK|nr:hypothetical protein pH8NP1_p005 [Polaromonas sp. H8N]